MDAAKHRKETLEWIAIGVALASDKRLDPAVFGLRLRQIVVAMMDETKPTTDALEVDIGVARKEGTRTKREGVIESILEEIARLNRNMELKRLATMMACASVAGNELERLAKAMEGT